VRSERVQRQIDRLLDEAEEAAGRKAWDVVRDRSAHVLTFDPESGDALALLSAAERGLAQLAGSAPTVSTPRGPLSGETSVPTSFCDGRYRVVRFLGEGGKKRVFLAHDTKLDRDVAFALIKTDDLNAEGEARIRREAQAMGKLGDHPNIVPVYDIGDESGQPYLVTQLMGGGDVEGLIEKASDHRVSLETALRIADQVCQALEYAHAKGIVHRDLKPGNVWLTADGTAKLGDFGLAVALDRSRLTQAGMMVGTVSYMPPEQAIGGDVTPRSDLYSLGAMLYELVTGRPPFVGDESVAIITQHLNTPPVSPSWHVPDLPTGLEALILRLLEKDPAKRPATASEVREALGTIPRGQSPGAKSEASASAPAVGPANPLYGRTFVGREQELRQLQSAYDAALSGQGSLAMVVGEPGIGKTSLCEQLATYVTVRGGRALVGHCYEEGSLSLPYLPFIEAMRSYVLTREPDGLRADLGSGAADVARLISEIRDALQVELRPPGDAEDDRWRLLQAVSTFLRNASSVQPLLIVLEDLHDAERGTIDLLLHLARNLNGTRLMIVGTYRDVEVDRAHPLSAALAELRRSGSFLRVSLRGLSVDEVHRMHCIIRGQQVPWSQAEAIHRQTEGNPLFVQEVLRYLVEEGVVIREGGRYLLADGDAGIPEGLRDVVGRRLSRLSERANQVLSVAAVIGREFRVDVLQRVAGLSTGAGPGLSEDELIGSLEEAQERAVIEERSATGGVLVFRFTHAFFRQTLYEEIFAARRIRWHQQVARALEEVHARRLDEHAGELAEHFAHSSDPEDLTKAVAYGELAAQRAMSVYAYGEAVRHLEGALKAQEVLDPDDRVRRCDLLLELGEALLPAGEARRALDVAATQALELAEALGDSRRASRACRIALNYNRGIGPMATGTPEADRWANVADRHAGDGTVDRVYADLFLRAVSRQYHGDESRARLFELRAAELAQQLDDPDALVASLLPFLEAVAIRPEDHAARISMAETLSRRSLDGVSSRFLAPILLAAGQSFLTWGRRAEAEDMWQRATEAAIRSQDASVALVPLRVEGLQAILDGRLEHVIELGERIQNRGVDLGSEGADRRQAGQTTRRALLYVGRVDEALNGIPETGELLANGGVFSGQRALFIAHAGRREEALQILRQFLAARDMSGSDDPTSASVLRYLLEASVVLQDAEAARVFEARMAPLAGLLHTDAGMIYCIGRLCGGAAVLMGQPEKAREYYEQALDVCTRARFRPELALTSLELAELLLAHYPDEKAAALEHLDFAIDEFRDMKMQPSLERALGHKGLLRA
jgi:tetratricopeptide (TPR) repeat protein